MYKAEPSDSADWETTSDTKEAPRFRAYITSAGLLDVHKRIIGHCEYLEPVKNKLRNPSTAMGERLSCQKRQVTAVVGVVTILPHARKVEI